MTALTSTTSMVADLASKAGRSVVRGAKRVELAMQVRRERRALSQLDDRLLKDIGISRSEAFREASRSIGDIDQRATLDPGAIAGYHMIRYRKHW
ncbi:MAG: DUF1127 domain-containing protein [Pseudomonadota bacterium]